MLDTLRTVPTSVGHHRQITRLDLTGRTALVTGAGSGIGAAMVGSLAAAGARVVLVDLRLDDIDGPARQLGPRGLALAADVTDAAAMSEAADATVEAFGSLDVCIANAGIAAAAPVTISATSTEEFERILEVDVLGVWRTVRACLPHVTDAGGHVLVTSSIYAFINGAANAPYAMSKAAVESFGRSLRAELAGTGVTAGVLYPGWVDTPIIAASHQEDSASRQLLELLIPGPLRTAVSPETVAEHAVAGIEQRRARVVVPRRWIPLALARGVVNMATDALIDRHNQVHRLMREI